MNILVLHALLGSLMEGKTIPELEKIDIRIGDQIESGPYEHGSVVGIYRGTDGDVIVCGGDDWEEEETGFDELPVVWSPPK